jgi:hypothetical protein
MSQLSVLYQEKKLHLSQQQGQADKQLLGVTKQLFFDVSDDSDNDVDEATGLNKKS